MAKKHHEKQRLVQVEAIRGRVMRMMARDLMSLRSFISMIPGNEDAVELLRGKSGEAILARVVDTVMMELGDNSSSSKTNAAGVSRYIASKAKGLLPHEELNGEPETA